MGSSRPAPAHHHRRLSESRRELLQAMISHQPRGFAVELVDVHARQRPRMSSAPARSTNSSTGIDHIVDEPPTSRQPSCVSEQGRERSACNALHDLVVHGACKDRDSECERPSSGPCQGAVVDVSRCDPESHSRTVVDIIRRTERSVAGSPDVMSPESMTAEIRRSCTRTFAKSRSPCSHAESPSTPALTGAWDRSPRTASASSSAASCATHARIAS